MLLKLDIADSKVCSAKSFPIVRDQVMQRFKRFVVARAYIHILFYMSLM